MNALRPGQTDGQFADYILKCIVTKNVYFDPTFTGVFLKGPINNMLTLG